jgi:hypothetical protein
MACVYYFEYSQIIHYVISLEINARTHVCLVFTHVKQSIQENKLLTNKKKTLTKTRDQQQQQAQIFFCVCVC